MHVGRLSSSWRGRETESFIHDSTAQYGDCHLDIYGSVRLESMFEGSLRTNYTGEMKLS